MKKLISIFILVFMVSCSSGPDYQRPESVTAEIDKFRNSPENQGSEKISKWWTRLGDPTSEKLVEKLIDKNFDIEASYSRLVQAIESSTIAGADLYPALSADFSASRSKSPALSQSFATGKPFDNFEVGLSTSWQVDLFGRTTNNIAARRAEIEASIFEIDALIQSLIAQTIGQRVTIAINSRKLKLAETIISSREKTLNIVERRYRAGAKNSSALDVRLARENLAAAKAELPNAEANLQESIYELDLLLGQAAGESESLDYQSFPLLPPPQDITIPPAAALLDRRPDLRASELRLITANKDIGVAIADLYPNLTFSASFGTNAREVSDLLDSDQIGWSLLGNISQKIFEAGKLRANVRLNEARYQELIANYKNDILISVKEAETALLREKAHSKQVKLLGENLREVKKAESIARDRYSKGIGDILVVLDTQRRLWQTAQNVLNAQEAQWKNRIALYLALGGDWNFNNKPLSIE